MRAGSLPTVTRTPGRYPAYSGQRAAGTLRYQRARPRPRCRIAAMCVGLCMNGNRTRKEVQVPKLKVGDDELDIDELEAAEYDEDANFTYTGPQPPKGTILTGIIKKAWWGETNAGKRMITILFEADEDSGKYEGCPIWDHIAFQENTKFRWKPFLDATGITLLDIKKKLYVDDQDDNIGAPIEKIGTWKPGTDTAAIRVVTTKERRDDEWQVKADKWLEYEEPEDVDDEEDEEELEDEEEVEEDDEEEEDEEPESPARTRRTATRRARPTATRPAKSAASSRTGAAKPARSKATATKAAKPPRGRAAKRSGYSDDPPF